MHQRREKTTPKSLCLLRRLFKLSIRRKRLTLLPVKQTTLFLYGFVIGGKRSIRLSFAARLFKVPGADLVIIKVLVLPDPDIAISILPEN